MIKHKKVIVGLVLGLVLVAATIGGFVMAADGENEAAPASKAEVMLDKVAANYLEATGEKLNIEALKEAFKDAKGELMTEAIEKKLKRLVEEGVITRDEASEWLDWWTLKPDSLGIKLPGHVSFSGPGKFFARPG